LLPVRGVAREHATLGRIIEICQQPPNRCYPVPLLSCYQHPIRPLHLSYSLRLCGALAPLVTPIGGLLCIDLPHQLGCCCFLLQFGGLKGSVGLLCVPHMLHPKPNCRLLLRAAAMLSRRRSRSRFCSRFSCCSNCWQSVFASCLICSHSSAGSRRVLRCPSAATNRWLVTCCRSCCCRRAIDCDPAATRCCSLPIRNPLPHMLSGWAVKKIQRGDGATCCDTHPTAPLVQGNHRRAM
jgi:hypothetical protein